MRGYEPPRLVGFRSSAAIELISFTDRRQAILPQPIPAFRSRGRLLNGDIACLFHSPFSTRLFA